ncbi:MAG: hypothetical protein ACE5KV_07015 [Thermoplasmata archaeon]
MPDGFLEWLGGVFHLITTDVLCMVGIIIFGVILASIIVIWYIRKILGREIWVH